MKKDAFLPENRFEFKIAMSKKRVLDRITEHFDVSISEEQSEDEGIGFVLRPSQRAVNRIAPARLYGTVSHADGKTSITFRAAVAPAYKVSALLAPILLLIGAICALLSSDPFNAVLLLLIVAAWEALLQLTFRATVNRTIKQLKELIEL